MWLLTFPVVSRLEVFNCRVRVFLVEKRLADPFFVQRDLVVRESPRFRADDRSGAIDAMATFETLERVVRFRHV